MMAASVVICAHTLDRWNELTRAVHSVRNQTRAAREIVVVVDNNDALRERAARELCGVTVLANAKESGLSGGRMTGAEWVTAPVIAFLDDDAVADPDWLEELLEAYADPAVLGAGGPVEPLWQAPPPSWFPDEFRWVVGCTYTGMQVRDGRIRNPIGANMSVRADVLRRTGGFTSQLGRRKLGFSVSGRGRIGGKAESCEETEFCIRAARLHPGGYWAYRPGACVHHAVPAQRMTWKYFVHRCLVEGSAKAVLTDLAGSKEGLRAEGYYVREVLPRAVVSNLRAAMDGKISDGQRAGAIIAGLAITAFAYAAARLDGAADAFSRQLRPRVRVWRT
ncbi:glycosyltransferase family 2 protein [Bradyrhizobium sp. GCM10027634]|uniref:glycosyltransferase family 2 protein n=1 Tax=unclassified Bradyrhizobium TaxID=2631580 RepID=UPI00263B0A8C|nr:glycosyltransferase family 2 protein [Bradyrhizobium sp. WYCCWR 12677]MDN5001396.1 glycosyltransferase family 2 protein [Bradyrhizobium sp. WYCCWR 12677]